MKRFKSILSDLLGILGWWAFFLCFAMLPVLGQAIAHAAGH